jgi:TonB family C-terminal domain
MKHIFIPILAAALVFAPQAICAQAHQKTARKASLETAQKKFQIVIGDKSTYQANPKELGAVPFKDVEVKPSFQGGDAGNFSKWVSDNLVYPSDTRARGRVNTQFSVETDGSVSEVVAAVESAKDTILANEAIRVIKNSPKWTPGTSNGAPCKVRYTFPVIFTTKNESASGKLDAAEASRVDDSVPFASVWTKPTFMGGDANEFSKWVNEQLRYPADAKKAGKQGRVTLTFTIAKDGSVQNVGLLRGVSKSLNEEALRVVKSSPNWTPGKNREGDIVPVTYTFPIIFKLK